MSQNLAPYIAPVIVLALLVWRGARAKPRPVRLKRMWISPLIVTLMTASTLALTAKPALSVMAAYAGAALAGAGIGYLFGRHREFSIDPATGELSSKATPLGTILVIGLFFVRFGLKLVFPQLAAQPGTHPSADVLVWTDGALVFACALAVSQVVSIWLHTRPLVAAHGAGGEKA
jgi:Kef-type K+ transport system membrane component KefB